MAHELADAIGQALDDRFQVVSRGAYCIKRLDELVRDAHPGCPQPLARYRMGGWHRKVALERHLRENGQNRRMESRVMVRIEMRGRPADDHLKHGYLRRELPPDLVGGEVARKML